MWLSKNVLLLAMSSAFRLVLSCLIASRLPWRIMSSSSAVHAMQSSGKFFKLHNFSSFSNFTTGFIYNHTTQVQTLNCHLVVLFTYLLLSARQALYEWMGIPINPILKEWVLQGLMGYHKSLLHHYDVIQWNSVDANLSSLLLHKKY